MGLFRRTSGVTLTVSPQQTRPGQLVTATLSTEQLIGRIHSARLQWGYTNFYRYHWAGRADSAAAAANEALWYAGNVGTNAGGDRDTEDWICVTDVEIPTQADQLENWSSTFRIPSWAPASSPEIAAWGARLLVDRGGRDIDMLTNFSVRTGPGDITVEDTGVELIMGDAETVIDIALPRMVFAAGGVIKGAVTLCPTKDLPHGDIGVCWQRHRESHPLTRSPTPGSVIDGPVIRLAKDIPLRAGVPVTMPFVIPLPADAAPTASAVNSSVRWFVQARLFYAGFSPHLTERVIRPIAVVSAP